jgi:hypothetical protein
MRRIILIFLLLPYLSWSMDKEFSSADSEDIENQRDTSPRTARSNSIYVRAVSQTREKLRNSQNMEVSSGLDELAQEIGEIKNNGTMAVEEVADYFKDKFKGNNLPGCGRFNPEDESQYKYLRSVIRIIERVDQSRYQHIVRHINRDTRRHNARGNGRDSRRAKKELIDVLGKIVGSIDAMNASSTHMAQLEVEQMKNQLAVAQASLETAKQSNANTTRRYRLSTIWTIIGGVLAVIATNLLQAYAGQIEATLNPMHNSTMAQNTTMS